MRDYPPEANKSAPIMRYNARVCRSYAGNTLAFFITIAHWYAHAVSYVRLPLHLWQEKKKERDGEKRKNREIIHMLIPNISARVWVQSAVAWIVQWPHKVRLAWTLFSYTSLLATLPHGYLTYSILGSLWNTWILAERQLTDTNQESEVHRKKSHSRKSCLSDISIFLFSERSS